jgi:hypothetical protein
VRRRTARPLPCSFWPLPCIFLARQHDVLP